MKKLIIRKLTRMNWLILGAAVAFAFVSACTKSEPTFSSGIGVGPITKVAIDAKIDSRLTAKGKQAFEAKCTACHKFDVKYVGPALNGVTKRRAPEWIMNMILNPTEMTQKDETAKALLGEYLSQMANQNVSQDDARAIYEYFRQNDVNQK